MRAREEGLRELRSPRPSSVSHSPAHLSVLHLEGAVRFADRIAFGVVLGPSGNEDRGGEVDVGSQVLVTPGVAGAWGGAGRGGDTAGEAVS